MLKRFTLVCFCGACAFGGGVVGAALWSGGPAGALASGPGAAPLPPPPPARGGGAVWELSDRFEAVVRQVGPCVVSIDATKPPAPAAAGGAGRGRPTEESGSGVLFRPEGVKGTLVLTNNHVVAAARPEQITVHLADDRVFRPEQVWADPESDVAVLLLGEDRLPVAVLGDSDRMRVGQWVLAFGSPFGLTRSVTHGIISARERGQISLGDTIRIKNFLQTDAAINPGSSGGPLVNMDGEVIGINTAIASQSGANSGVAFAIPINLARRIAGQLVADGKVQRGYLGVQLAPALEPAEALRLGLSRVTGALVETVYPETPAAAAGLRAGDVILEVAGQPVRDENHLINQISGMRAGERVRLRIWRERSSQLVEVVVGDWAQAQPRLRQGR